MTSCKIISDKEMTLHCTAEEMAFVWDLLNSVTHPTAAAIRSEVEKVIRGNNCFQIYRTERIERCEPCKGSGKLQVSASAVNYDKKIANCDKCQGEGQRVIITTWRYEKLSNDRRMQLAPVPGPAIKKI